MLILNVLDTSMSVIAVIMVAVLFVRQKHLNGYQQLHGIYILRACPPRSLYRLSS
jgi:hypothetical protein